ncbi:RICIN domain-containing protein [Streptomyces sp. S1D4-11]
MKKAQDTDLSFKNTISGLDDYPGSPKAEKIFDKTGMLPWLYQSYFKSVDLLSPFYDPSPQADDKTKKAALAVGDPLYTSGGTSEEQEAWKLWKKNSGDVVPGEIFVPRVFDDDARIFLASGGFPRTAPAPDSPEFRIAVEDLKSRFASCAWHGPIDPDRVLGKEVAQASGEWQQEITSQATQRNQILAAGTTATKALQDGTFALGKMLGQSWIADYSTRWLDYYTEGGLGWIGDGQLEIQVPGAAGKCLDVAGGGKTNGTPVQVYTCNGGASQKWQLMGSYDGGYTLVNPNSFKCLEVLNGNSADGTKIQIRDCGSAQAQQWKFDVRSVSPAGERGDRQVPAPADVRQQQGRRAVGVQRLRRAEVQDRPQDPHRHRTGKGRCGQGQGQHHRCAGRGEEAARPPQDPAGYSPEGRDHVGHRAPGGVRHR